MCEVVVGWYCTYLCGWQRAKYTNKISLWHYAITICTTDANMLEKKDQVLITYDFYMSKVSIEDNNIHML